MTNMKAIATRCRLELKKYIEAHNIKSLVLGVSGGLDSTVVACLARPVAEMTNIRLIGMSLPARSNTENENSRAYETCNILCTEGYVKNVDASVVNILSKFALRLGNVKARVRMIHLYDKAQEAGGMVLSTDNLTEYYLGFWTLHGDVGDFGMIQNLWKSEVYELADYLVDELKESDFHEAVDVVSKSIQAMPTDGLGISDSDLDQILADGWRDRYKTHIEAYEHIDGILMNLYMGDMHQEFRGVDAEAITKRYRTNRYKRNNPYNIARNILFGDIA